MGNEPTLTVDDVRLMVQALAAALHDCGATSAAGVLHDAQYSAPAGTPEELLDLRSALVRTRHEWEPLDDRPLVERARRVLAAAKRLAIEPAPG